MSEDDRLGLFNLLSFATSVLSVTAMILALNSNWRWVAGAAILGCLVYQIRIWLIMPLVKKNG